MCERNLHMQALHCANDLSTVISFFLLPFLSLSLSLFLSSLLLHALLAIKMCLLRVPRAGALPVSFYHIC